MKAVEVTRIAAVAVAAVAVGAFLLVVALIDGAIALLGGITGHEITPSLLDMTLLKRDHWPVLK